MKKVLIAGGAGYIGCQLISRLLDLNYYVYCYDILIYGDNSLKQFSNLENFEISISHTTRRPRTSENHKNS